MSYRKSGGSKLEPCGTPIIAIYQQNTYLLQIGTLSMRILEKVCILTGLKKGGEI